MSDVDTLEVDIAGRLIDIKNQKHELFGKAAADGFTDEIKAQVKDLDKTFDDTLELQKVILETNRDTNQALSSIEEIRENTDPEKFKRQSIENLKDVGRVFFEARQNYGTIELEPPKITSGGETNFEVEITETDSNKRKIQSHATLPSTFGMTSREAIVKASEVFDIATSTTKAGQFHTPDLYSTLFSWGAQTNPMLNDSIVRVINSESIADLQFGFVADWSTTTNTAEAATIAATDATLQGNTLKSQNVSKITKISDQMMRLASDEFDNVLAEEMANNIFAHLNTQLTTGSGTGGNLTGLITAVEAETNNVNSTTIDYAADTILAAFIALQDNVEDRFATRGSYMANRKVLGKIRASSTEKFLTGQQVANQLDIDARNRAVRFYVDGAIPAYSNPAMHSDVETAGKTFLFGDFRQWITRAGSMSIQFLNELYAASNQVGIKASIYCGGQLIFSGPTSGLPAPIQLTKTIA